MILTIGFNNNYRLQSKKSSDDLCSKNSQNINSVYQLDRIIHQMTINIYLKKLT